MSEIPKDISKNIKEQELNHKFSNRLQLLVSITNENVPNFPVFEFNYFYDGRCLFGWKRHLLLFSF